MSHRSLLRGVVLATFLGVASTAFANADAPPAASVAEAGDGEWTAILPSGRNNHTAIYDSARDRMIEFAGSDAISIQNDVWTLPLSGSSVWSPIVASGTKPGVRIAHTAIYDPIRDRMLVFAGNPGIYPPRDDLWELTLSGTPTWTQLSPAGATPYRRFGHTAFYDPVRDRMVVFGGFDGTIPSNDVWALSLSGTPTWTQIAPTGTPPSARWHHTAIYDAARDRMLVFGGWDGIEFSTDVWALSLSGSPAWSLVSASGTPPPGQWRHTAIYDPDGDQMIVFGGADLGKAQYNIHALTLSGTPQWTTVDPSNSGHEGGSGHAAFYDPIRNRMVVHGGGDPDRAFALELSGTPEWTSLSEPPINRRGYHAAILDPVRDRMLVFGGLGYGTSNLNDLWELSLPGPPDWNALTPSGTFPPGRHGHSALYDPVRDRMIVFGGLSVGFFNDVRLLSLSGFPMIWSMLTPSGAPPPGRFLHSAIYDPVRDRMIVFGGVGGGFRNDVWALALAGTPAWSLMEPAGSAPTPRCLHAAVYDPEQDRMLVFGGEDVDGHYLRDLWALSLSGTPEWTLLNPEGPSPPGGSGPGAIYDPVRSRMVVFGGLNSEVIGGFNTNGRTNEAWSLNASGTAWKILTPSGDLPVRRAGASVLYDAVRDEMVVYGGDGRIDVWKLSWSFLVDDVPMPRVSNPSMMYAPRPNPMYSSAEIRYELADDAHVSLDVLDIQGRIVRRLRHGVQAAGVHSVKFDRLDDRGRSLPAGLYLIRLGTREATRTTRIVLLP